METPFPILGFDVGGTKVAVSLVLSNGTLIASSRVPNKERNPDDVLPAMVSAGKSLLADAGIPREDLKAVGVCTPSPLDFKNGIVMGPPNMKLWRHVPIRDYLSNAFGVRAFFDNDANASGLAEWLFGSGVGVAAAGKRSPAGAPSPSACSASSRTSRTASSCSSSTATSTTST